ncbi:MAG: N-6 DNA methylase [Bacteroidales bacterium]|nr:N-6 DNA methylase [Bacteroidales bacterium]
MSIFQKSVIKKYLSALDKEKLENAYQVFRKNFNPRKIEEIKNMKEEEYQDGFLRDLFVDVLGYTLKPDENYDLVREFKNQADGKKADGAILSRGNDSLTNKAIAVIELKSTKTKDLKSITEQAFNYKINQADCKYVITSNFQKLRFYIDYTNEFEEFNLFNLDKENFELLYLILCKENVFSGLPLKLKEETKFHEQEISDKLYKNYSDFKNRLFDNLIINNTEHDKLTLFKKSQKLLDRFLFVLFAEDSGLLPPNSISRIIKRYEILKEEDAYKPLYDIFKQYFGYMNIGRKGKTPADNIPEYNGGLFYPDELLDNLKIDDETLIKDLLHLSEYDFNTDVDVNILGHIFEHSLSEIEEITAEIEGTTTNKTKSKRKKDGVFYTPKYITQYIVENTLGKLCSEKRKELEIVEIEFDGTYRLKEGKLSVKGKKLYKKLQEYKDWMFSLKIVDPACGSGAFLNQALNFLIEEHKNIDDIIAELTNTSIRLFDTEKIILENNLYGVDINEESVEIAKLSLWLRTAQKGRRLSVLSNNIKCGNSLIDDPEVAGEKAFNWHTEFPGIFQKKKKKIWHITTATHNSRYSQRMFDNYVKTGKPVWLTEKEEIIVTQTIAEIAEEDNLNIIAYNICGDHVHILAVCEEDELPKIVQKLKSMSARACNIAMGRTIAGIREHAPLKGQRISSATSEQATTSELAPMSVAHSVPRIGACSDAKHTPVSPKRGKTQHHLWTQKFGKKEITSNEQLENTIEYINNNRKKHQLPENKELQTIINKLCCSRQHAFRTEYKGGFDLVIGNPPYGILIDKSTQDYYQKNFPLTRYKTNLYILFLERMLQIFNKGIVHFIIPKSLLFNTYFELIRRELITKTEINELYSITEKVFEDAEVGSSLLLRFTIKEKPNNNNIVRLAVAEKSQNFISGLGVIENKVPQNHFLNIPNCEISIVSSNNQSIINKLQDCKSINDFYDLKNGLNPGNIKHILISNKKTKPTQKPIIWGKEISKYGIIWGGDFVEYDEKISKNITIDDLKSKKGMNKQSKIDFALRKPELFENRKIVVRKTGDSLIGCIDNNNYYFDTLVHGIYEKEHGYTLEVLLAIINSRPATVFYRLLHDIKGKVVAKISLDNLGAFPIPEINKSISIKLTDFSNLLLKSTSKVNQLSGRFINRLKSNLEIEKVSSKLGKFYDYDFKAFVAELKKQKVKLSLTQQDEWEEYFNAYKTEINQLQDEINATDKEIDQMVYKLYELTEDEIEIVEKSIG